LTIPAGEQSLEVETLPSGAYASFGIAHEPARMSEHDD
jgi:hypothetical protein